MIYHVIRLNNSMTKYQSNSSSTIHPALNMHFKAIFNKYNNFEIGYMVNAFTVNVARHLSYILMEYFR